MCFYALKGQLKKPRLRANLKVNLDQSPLSFSPCNIVIVGGDWTFLLFQFLFDRFHLWGEQTSLKAPYQMPRVKDTDTHCPGIFLISYSHMKHDIWRPTPLNSPQHEETEVKSSTRCGSSIHLWQSLSQRGSWKHQSSWSWRKTPLKHWTHYRTVGVIYMSSDV